MPPQLPVPPRDLLTEDVLAAAEALARGELVLLYDQDGREEETDLLVAAEHCTPEMVHALRRDAGGLIFLAVDRTIGDLFQLPFAQDIQETAAAAHPLLDKVTAHDIAYDARSSFSLWVNHRDTFTGITDTDRSLTITKIAETAEDAWALPDTERTEGAPDLFGQRFRAPGHVSLCVGHPDGPAGRQGHTELASALARIAGVTPVVAGCEMLDGNTGRALSRSDAEKYARNHGLAFLRGERLTEAYRKWHGTPIIPGA